MTPASSFPARPGGSAPRPATEGAPPVAGRPGDALPAGTPLGGSYRIERTLGQGGFGIVYLAIDLALQRPVAIKEFLPVHLALRLDGLSLGLREPAQRDAFDRGLQSFLREARLLAQFDHPSLVRVYCFWEENQTAYMAMPYYEGVTLAVKRRRMLRPPDEAWLRERMLLPLLGALQALHEGHCLHRDVAPANILLLPDGRPILLDFGSARRIVGDMTQPLTAIVNPAYAAIEQYAESPTLPQGPWTDLYGLAGTAYFALSGRAPAPATVRALNETALMPMAEVGQAIAQSFPGLHYSPAFLAAIDRALSLRPADRPQSATEFREALTHPHVRPDVAFEELRKDAPPACEEIRVPADPESAAAAERPPDAAAQAAIDPADSPGQGEAQAALRATILTALGEIADWPTLAPGARTRRPGSDRMEPAFEAGTDASAPPEARRVAPGKAHLKVIASAQMREHDDANPMQPSSEAEASAHPAPGDGAGLAAVPAVPAVPAEAAVPAAPAPEAGPSLKAAAAVVAAVLLGGGLWYAQDLGRLAWQWAGAGHDSTAPTPAAAPAPGPRLALADPSPAAPLDSPPRPPATDAVGTSGTGASAPIPAEAPPRVAQVAVPPAPHTNKPVRLPPPRVAHAEPASPPSARAACGARRNFALYYCMKAQCRLARYAHSAECMRLRENDEVE